MNLRCGIDWEIEDRTTDLLIADRMRRGVHRGGRVMVEEPYPWLSPGQYENRMHHEVYTAAGYPDPEIVEGRFWRVHNPLFGCHSPPKPDR